MMPAIQRVMWAAVLSAIVAVPGQGQGPPRHRLLGGTGDTVRVRIVDRASGRPIAGSDVEVYSDNGIRCATTPCPTGGRTWTGRSDADGVVRLPKAAINTVTHLGTPTHEMGDLSQARSGRTGTWVLRLVRRSDAPGSPEGPHDRLTTREAPRRRAAAGPATAAHRAT